MEAVVLEVGLLVRFVTLTISMARIVVGGGRVPLVLNRVVVEVDVTGVVEGFLVILVVSGGTKMVVGVSARDNLKSIELTKCFFLLLSVLTFTRWW